MSDPARTRHDQDRDAEPGPLPDPESLGDRIGAIASAIRGVGDRQATSVLTEEMYTAAARLDVIVEDLFRAPRSEGRIGSGRGVADHDDAFYQDARRNAELRRYGVAELGLVLRECRDAESLASRSGAYGVARFLRRRIAAYKDAIAEAEGLAAFLAENAPGPVAAGDPPRSEE